MPDAAVPPARLIVVGRIRKPHGLHGEIAVMPLTDDADAVFVAGRALQVLTLGGEVTGEVVIEMARVYHRQVLIRLRDHATRDGAERFRERFLAVPVETLPPLAEGEVYQQELVGWAVRDEHDAALGLVTAVYDLPQGSTIEVQGARREFLLPFRAAFVKTIDRDRRQLVVAVPEGLLE